MSKETLVKAFSDFLDGVVGGTKREAPPTVEVMKSLDNELQQATFVVLEAFDDDTGFDLHEDTYSAEEVAKACYDYNRNCMKANLAHMFMVEDDLAYVLESYVSPVDIQIDEVFVRKGSWLQTWKFTDDSLWQGVKDGQWSGLSIQCMAETEEL